MKIALVTLLFIVGVTATARARLGETADQLVQRYGQPISETDQKGEGDKIALSTVMFEKGGYQIYVTVTEGVSVAEMFKKLNGQPINIDEARTLLTANGQGYEWDAPQPYQGEKWWTRQDGATARLTRDGLNLFLKSKELASQEAAAKKAETQPTLDGF